MLLAFPVILMDFLIMSKSLLQMNRVELAVLLTCFVSAVFVPVSLTSPVSQSIQD
jgi:uncharacterized membrane protein YczE